MTKANGKMCARRDFKCSLGIKYFVRWAAKRPGQRVNYTGCKVESMLTLNFNLHYMIVVTFATSENVGVLFDV